jgi:hypothetical protein
MRKNNSIFYLPDPQILPVVRSRARAPRLTRRLGPDASSPALAPRLTRRKLSCPRPDSPAAQDPDAQTDAKRP